MVIYSILMSVMFLIWGGTGIAYFKDWRSMSSDSYIWESNFSINYEIVMGFFIIIQSGLSHGQSDELVNAI